MKRRNFIWQIYASLSVLHYIDDSLSQLTRTHSPQSNQITRRENVLTASLYMFVTQAQPLERRSVTQLTSLFDDDDDDRCSIGKKNLYIHEHEQFNLLIRFSILTKLMIRIEGKENAWMFVTNVNFLSNMIDFNTM